MSRGVSHRFPRKKSSKTKEEGEMGGGKELIKMEERSFSAHFFIITYRKAFPRVCPSSANWNDAAVSVAPGSCGGKITLLFYFPQ